jgi:ribonuclease HI
VSHESIVTFVSVVFIARTSAVACLPEYWLLIDTVGDDSPDHEPGEWRLSLQVVGGEVELDITDVEPDVRGERLELLTVVRGLEALDQPSRVTVVTASRYVRRGIEASLLLVADRRTSRLQERASNIEALDAGRWAFDVRRPEHADLWERLDHAASIHEIRCVPSMRPLRPNQRRVDGPHGLIRRRRRPARSGFWGAVRGWIGA